MAASVRTLVVSWKEAAEMKESILSDGARDAQEQRPGDGGLSALVDDPAVLVVEACTCRSAGRR